MCIRAGQDHPLVLLPNLVPIQSEMECRLEFVRRRGQDGGCEPATTGKRYDRLVRVVHERHSVLLKNVASFFSSQNTEFHGVPKIVKDRCERDTPLRNGGGKQQHLLWVFTGARLPTFECQQGKPARSRDAMLPPLKVFQSLAQVSCGHDNSQ